jgi:hypothetical protein
MQQQPMLSLQQVRWWVAEVAREDVANENWSPASRQQAARDMERWVASRAEWRREAMQVAVEAQRMRRAPCWMRPRPV